MIDDEFEASREISAAHAVRTAARLAHVRRFPKRDTFAHGLAPRMWAILETHPAAREVYGCPHDLTLAEHGEQLSIDELDEAAARFAQVVGSDETVAS